MSGFNNHVNICFIIYESIQLLLHFMQTVYYHFPHNIKRLN